MKKVKEIIKRRWVAFIPAFIGSVVLLLWSFTGMMRVLKSPYEDPWRIYASIIGFSILFILHLGGIFAITKLYLLDKNAHNTI